MNSHRLAPPFGSLINRDKPITLNFEGRDYAAFEGDTIASALMANGIRVLSRSFKYHRPRGVLSMAAQDANSLVQVEGEPSVRADISAVPVGKKVRGQNYLGSLDNDWLNLLEIVSPFLPVGFYYKAFFKPKGVWKYWEKLIRAMAGLGRVDIHSHHGYADKMYLFADVAVVGGGVAGMQAALEAAQTGAEVILIDDQAQLGGALNFLRVDVEGRRGTQVAAELRARVHADARIRVLSKASCTGWFADNWLAVMQGQRLYKLRAKSVVIATGVIEQPLVFRHNDLPGVMYGSAAQRLIRLYGVKPGERAVIATANANGYAVALDLIDAGVKVQAVVDLRAQPGGSVFESAVSGRGIEILYGHTVYEVIPGPGKRTIFGVVIDAIVSEGRVGGRPRTVECDLLCTSVGYTPAAQLVCHSGGQLAYDEALSMLVIDKLPGTAAVAAGAVNSVFDLDASLAEGRHAGWRAAQMAGSQVDVEPAASPARVGAKGQNHPWPIFSHPDGKDFIDVDEDLQTRDIINAVADGYDDLDLVKRYSTVVMGPSQGRHSALNNLRLATVSAGRALAGATVTTQRPPYQPELLEVLGGRGFQPTRLTAMHHRHLALGAQMMPAGVWLRPAYYGSEAQRRDHIDAEVKAVRENVGLIDVSTLGKLEVRGADAAEFLNRIYTFAYAKQPVGRSRYVLMTDSTGAIADDGVACRVNANHFYVTATTSGVDAVYRSMLRWNAEWRLDVDVANVTAAYAAVNLAGPKSREVLSKLAPALDVSNAAFPYMGVREGEVAGVPARLLRVGFVGELGYEIHVPASQGEHLWDALMDVGRGYGIRAFGVEAQRVLRLEKGHIIIGQDTDGLTFPQEAEMGWAIAASKPFYVGKRAIDVQAARPLNRRLVGFTLPADSKMPEECHITVRDGNIVGRVTSVTRSPTLGRVIGLAYVAPDQSAPGTRFDIKLGDGAIIQGEVVTLPFYDPESKRQEI
ncbi:MAG: 2Fe-2S iron-sulfur cluster-binding protein [Gammaproteobacteria bacterium]